MDIYEPVALLLRSGTLLSLRESNRSKERAKNGKLTRDFGRFFLHFPGGL